MRISDWSSDVCSSDLVRDQRVTDLWGQAGNAWLVAGEAEKARAAFNTALAHGGGSDDWKGELYIDRARALVELGQPDAARADLDRRSEEHTSELQSLLRISYSGFRLQKKEKTKSHTPPIRRRAKA